MCTFEVHLCMMSGQLILTGKPFNTFFHGKVKNIAIASDPHQASTLTFFLTCPFGQPTEKELVQLNLLVVQKKLIKIISNSQICNHLNSSQLK